MRGLAKNENRHQQRAVETVVINNRIAVLVDRDLTHQSIEQSKVTHTIHAIARRQRQIDLAWEFGRGGVINLTLDKKVTVVMGCVSNG